MTRKWFDNTITGHWWHTILFSSSVNFNLSFLHFISNQSHSLLTIRQVLLFIFQWIPFSVVISSFQKFQFNGPSNSVFYCNRNHLFNDGYDKRALFFRSFSDFGVYILIHWILNGIASYTKNSFDNLLINVQHLNWINSMTTEISNVQRRTQRAFPFLYSPMSLHNSMHKKVLVYLFNFFLHFHLVVWVTFFIFIWE